MANQDTLRYVNLLDVFHLIEREGSVTRKTIQERLGLSWGGASNIIARLLGSGIILASGEAASTYGRAPAAYAITSGRFLLLGLDLSPQGMTGVLSDLCGRIHRQLREPLPQPGHMPILKGAQRMIAALRAGLPQGEPRGIGLSLPLEGLEGAGQALSELTGLQAAAQRDVACAALWAHRFGMARAVDDFLLLRLGDDLEMAGFAQGVLLQGHAGQSGMIGHMILQPDGPKCRCGANGCLAAYASGRALEEQGKEALTMGLSPTLATLARETEPSAALVLEAANAGDAYCRTLLARAASYTGMALANVIRLYDPACILFDGTLGSDAGYASQIMEAASRHLADRKPPAFHTVSDHGLSSAQGAASLLIDRVFSLEMAAGHPARHEDD